MPIEAAPTVRESLVSAMETVTEAPPVETPAPAPVEEVKAEAPPVETEAQKAERLRDEKGRFVEGKQEAKPEPKAAPAPKPATPKPPRPSSWKKELEPHWETLPPEVQSYIGEREKQYATGVSTYKTEADRARDVMGVVSQFQPTLDKFGVPVTKWLTDLGNAHHALALGSPQDKAAQVARIIQGYGVDVNVLGQILQGQQPIPQAQVPQQPQFSPADIEATVEKALLNKEVNQKWNAFQADVSGGKYPHFETVKETMAGLLQSGLAEDYPSAYEAALRHPRHADIYEALQQQQAEQKEAERAAAQKAQVGRARSQAVSVKSSTPSAMTQASGPKGLRDHISDAFDKVTSGRV